MDISPIITSDPDKINVIIDDVNVICYIISKHYRFRLYKGWMHSINNDVDITTEFTQIKKDGHGQVYFDTETFGQRCFIKLDSKTLTICNESCDEPTPIDNIYITIDHEKNKDEIFKIIDYLSIPIPQ